MQVLYVHKDSASLFALTEDIQKSDILNVISKLESNKSLRFNCVLRDFKKVISKVPFRSIYNVSVSKALLHFIKFDL